MTSHAAMTAAADALQMARWALTQPFDGWTPEVMNRGLVKVNEALAALAAELAEPMSVDPVASLRVDASVGTDRASGVASPFAWPADCGLSWDGKRVQGDRASIDAVREALHLAGIVPQLRDMLADATRRGASAGDQPSNEKTPESAPLSVEAQLDLAALLKAAKAVAYSNGFDAAYPDKLDALCTAIKRIDAVLPRSEEG